MSVSPLDFIQTSVYAAQQKRRGDQYDEQPRCTSDDQLVVVDAGSRLFVGVFCRVDRHSRRVDGHWHIDGEALVDGGW